MCAGLRATQGNMLFHRFFLDSRINRLLKDINILLTFYITYMNTNSRLISRRSVCLVMIGFISVAEATVPPIPKGICFACLLQGANGFPDQILNDSRIVGLDLGDQWHDIETTEGVYDWSSLDSELAKAEAHGKKVVLGNSLRRYERS